MWHSKMRRDISSSGTTRENDNKLDSQDSKFLLNSKWQHQSTCFVNDTYLKSFESQEVVL